MAYDFLAAAQNALNTLGINTGGASRSAISADDVNIATDTGGKSHTAYAQKLIDDEKNKQYLADLATQTEALKAQTAALGTPAAAAAAAAAPATRYLTADDVKGLNYSNLVRGYQDVVGDYQKSLFGKRDTSQYSNKMSQLGSLMGGYNDATTGGNYGLLDKLDYNTYKPLIDKYSGSTIANPKKSNSLTNSRI